MSEEATPRPWTYSEHGGAFFVWGPGQAMVADGAPDEPHISQMRGTGRGARAKEQAANAALIVRAVNSHDALVAALRDVLRIAKAASGGVTGNQPRIERAESALAAASK